jgi:CO dehydrogenase/acetyl-CoA synthase alpha subunit
MAACKAGADDGIDEMTKLMARLFQVERDNERLREQLRAKDVDEALKKVEEEQARKLSKTNKIYRVKQALKAGKLTRKMYDFVRDEVNTKITRNNFVEAFKAYNEACGKAGNEDLTFAKMLEEMEAILAANEGDLEGELEGELEGDE